MFEEHLEEGVPKARLDREDGLRVALSDLQSNGENHKGADRAAADDRNHELVVELREVPRTCRFHGRLGLFARHGITAGFRRLPKDVSRARTAGQADDKTENRKEQLGRRHQKGSTRSSTCCPYRGCWTSEI